MIITTQIKDPGLDNANYKWIPCQEHQRVTHEPVRIADYDIVIASHWLCWEYWDQKVKDIGGVREIYTVGASDKFESLGLITKTHKSADDIEILPNKQYLWLRGNGAFRDFSGYDNVKEVQTHQTQVSPGMCQKVLHEQPRELWIYSSRVLKYMESKGPHPETFLYHVPSCSPKTDLWQGTEEFYPGEETWRGTI